MARYLLGYRIEGAIRAYNPGRPVLDFQFRGFYIKIPTTVDTDPSHFECFLSPVEAENLVKANDTGNEIISEFLDNVSFVTKTSLFTIGMSTVLKDESGKSERVVFRQVYWEEDQTSLRIRENAPESQSIRELLVKAETSNDYLLALRWLRYSYRARGYIDQFTYNLALERLVGETQIERVCKHCQKKLTPYPSIDRDEVMKLLKKHNPELDTETSKAIWKARNRVFHGGSVDTDFMIELVKLSPIVGKAVEAELVERLVPSERFQLDRPHPSERLVSQQSFYKFTTANPNESFAMDYPTNAQLMEFKEEGKTKSEKYGFEHIFEAQF